MVRTGRILNKVALEFLDCPRPLLRGMVGHWTLSPVPPPMERGLRIALQAMLEKKAVMSRKRGRLVGFLYLRRQCGVSHEV